MIETGVRDYEKRARRYDVRLDATIEMMKEQGGGAKEDG